MVVADAQSDTSTAMRAMWLAGGPGGLFSSPEGASWSPVGESRLRVTSIVRTPSRTCVGVGGGVWEVPGDGSRWRQLHDETVTEVLDLGTVAGDPGLVVASAYGVAVGARDELGAVRWASRSAELAVDERFANTIAVDPHNPHRWLVGTEAGLLVAEDEGGSWTHSGLMGTPVRGICHALGCWWAGADERGIWQSPDGLAWRRAGLGLDEETVFAVSASGDRILAGTMGGAVVGDGRGHWHRCGPRGLVAAVAAHPEDTSCWMIGLLPGGVWTTRDSGRSWRHAPDLTGRIETIIAPEGRTR